MLSSQKQLKRLSHSGTGLYEPTEAEARRMKQIILSIYKDIARVCRENGLTLILGGGSALGAVRHKGYIPWDDDMDAMLSRADFEEFKRIFADKMPDKYALQVPNAPGCVSASLYMKVVLRGTELRELQRLRAPGERGLWVDIFPIDYAPNCALMRRAKGFMVSALAYLAVSNYLRAFTSPELKAFMCQTRSGMYNYRLRMLLGFLTGFMPYTRMYDAFDKFCRCRRETRYVTVPTGIRHYMGEMHLASEYFPPSEGEFEGERVLLPKDVHGYLKKLYGDYMTPPPPEARERHFYVSMDLGKYASEGYDEG